MHELGLSYGDFKLDNICGRVNSKFDDSCPQFTIDNLTFNLIDLGMSTKLSPLGLTNDSKEFRGNLMYASTYQFSLKRPRRIDDIFSLLCVVYFLMKRTLPWINHFQALSMQNPHLDIYNQNSYMQLRQFYRQNYEKEFIKCSGVLSPIFAYVIDLQRKQWDLH